MWYDTIPLIRALSNSGGSRNCLQWKGWRRSGAMLPAGCGGRAPGGGFWGTSSRKLNTFSWFTLDSEYCTWTFCFNHLETPVRYVSAHAAMQLPPPCRESQPDSQRSLSVLPMFLPRPYYFHNDIWSKSTTIFKVKMNFEMKLQLDDWIRKMCECHVQFLPRMRISHEQISRFPTRMVGRGGNPLYLKFWAKLASFLQKRLFSIASLVSPQPLSHNT